ncbi:MAG: hypothetical protein ACOYMD_01985 [Paludibacter sp.]
MNTNQLLDEVLGHIRLIKDDRNKLELVLEFLQDQLDSDEEELDEIPPKFEKLLKQIAQTIDGGCICYLNTDTLEMEDFAADLMDQLNEYDEGMEDEIPMKNSTWENCFEICPLESHESFGIMENFMFQLTDKKLQNVLSNALNRKKPFANFKRIVESSTQRKAWFEFKDNELQKHVRTLLYLHLTYGNEKKGNNDSVDPNILPF